jgi:hypothetical protein
MSNTTIFANLGFDLLNPKDNPALLQNREKRDQLKVRDQFNNFRDFNVLYYPCLASAFSTALPELSIYRPTAPYS